MAEPNGATSQGSSATATKSARKYFIPLENNPEVFNALLRSLHISDSLTCHDIFSFDKSNLVHIPRPAHALIFIVPNPVWQRSRDQDEAATSIDPYAESGSQEPVLWFRQTIGNACGLMAMLHALANGSARSYVPDEGQLSAIFRKAVDMKPEPRAKLIYDSQFLESAHASAAMLGDTVPPALGEPNEFHFISFVKGDDGNLWELEGGWKGPINRGPLKAGEDVLSETALDIGPKLFLQSVGDGGIECWFSCVALCDEG